MVTPSVNEGEARDKPFPPLSIPDPIKVKSEDLISSSEAEKRNSEEGTNEVADEVWFSRCVDDLVTKADELEKKVNEVSEFFASRKHSFSKGTSVLKEKERQFMNSNNNNNDNNCCNNSGTKRPVDGSTPQLVRSKRMQELMRQFGTILRQASIIC